MVLAFLEMQLEWFALEIVQLDLDETLEVIPICNFLTESHGVYDGSFFWTVENILDFWVSDCIIVAENFLAHEPEELCCDDPE